ncbi:MAG: hypothetical protein ACRDP4_05615 [Nocardioidaceae bacterium]
MPTDTPQERSLSDFENPGPTAFDSLNGVLPPRRRDNKRANTPEPTAGDTDPSPDEPEATSTDTSTPKPDTRKPRSSAGRPRKRTRTDSAKASDSSTGGSRGTTMHIPVNIYDRFHATRDQRGLSNGALVIEAIEATLDQIPKEIGGRGTAGGERFQRRTTHRKSPSEAEQLTLLNLRFLESDYAVLDELVAETGARSRNHLVVAALKLHLHTDT